MFLLQIWHFCIAFCRKLKNLHSEFKFHSLVEISADKIGFCFTFSYLVSAELNEQIDNLQPSWLPLRLCHCEPGSANRQKK